MGFKRLCPQPGDMSENERGRNDLRMPEEDELFAEVKNMLGANRVKVRCEDGVERTARIPGRMQKRIWIREDDVVLVEPWDWQDEKGDIVWRYEKSEADQLREEGHIG
jgi:translation initiation factor 1A